MPGTQGVLRFPHRKARSTSKSKSAISEPAPSLVSAAAEAELSPVHHMTRRQSRTRPNGSRTPSSRLCTASVVYPVDSEDDDVYSPNRRMAPNSPQKRRHQGSNSRSEEDLLSPKKSPRTSQSAKSRTMPGKFVSPLRLRVVSKDVYSPVKKTGNRKCSSLQEEVGKVHSSDRSKSREEDDSDGCQTLSSDDEIQIKRPKKKIINKNLTKKNTKRSKCPIIDSSSEDEEQLNTSESSNSPKAPMPSPAHIHMRSPLKSLASHLNTDQLELKLNSLVGSRATPTKTNSRVSLIENDENKENTPVKQTSTQRAVFSPLRLNKFSAAASPQQSPAKSQKNVIHAALLSPKRKTILNHEDDSHRRSPRCNSTNNDIFSPRRHTPRKLNMDEESNKSPTKEGSKHNLRTPVKSLNLSSPPRVPSSTTPSDKLINAPKSPYKFSNHCGLTPALLHQILSSPAKVPVKKCDMDPAQSAHPRSPMKHLVESSSPEVRRSPRKHVAEATSSPLRGLMSPVRRLTLADKGSDQAVVKLHKPDVSVHQAVRQALAQQQGELVGREPEVESMTQFLQQRLSEGRPGAMYVSGAPGTGKTAALTQILSTLPETRRTSALWVNCMGLHCSSAVFGRIAKELGVPAQATELKTVRAIERHLTKQAGLILLVLDEVDQLETRHQEVLYTVFEWPALQRSRLLLVAIANRLDLTERVLPRLAAGASCAPERLHFPPYTKKQILDILTSRLEKSGVSWREVVRPPALQLLAGKVASVAGDARRALDVCRRAVELCQAKVAAQTTLLPSAVSPAPKAAVVDIPSIVRIFNEVYGSRVVTALTTAPATFPIQQKILLCCLLLVQKHAKVKDTTMGKLEEVYRRVCSNRQVPAVDASEFRALCSLLQTRAMLDVTKSKDARMAKVSLRLDADEAERALADRELMMQILEDREALGKLAKKMS